MQITIKVDIKQKCCNFLAALSVLYLLDYNTY